MSNNIPADEKEILEFWKKERVFEKSLERESPRGDFVFYDGPPFATGTPHYGHIVASLIKDMIPRYKTMRGYHVERKWGWDCHGLPIENIVEKELNLQGKKDIEDLGVANFNQNCRSKVMLYADEWQKVIERFGRWVDMDHCYQTMDTDFMESVWWVFKQLWEKGLIYESYKAMHICPRCETTLSQSEVSQGYKDVKDISVTVKFKLAPGQTVGKLKTDNDIYILAWTTTPWTLPGNVALAIGADLEYVKVACEGEKYIVLKDRAEEVFAGKDYEVLSAVAAVDLAGKKYLPLFDYYLNDASLNNREWLYTIQTADFVTTEDGTGIVHIAPAFGEDDMRLGQEKKLPFIQHVGMDGRFKGEVADFAGQDVKPADDPTRTDLAILKFLAAKNLIFSKAKFEHSYPHCWRCDAPLLNYATSSWFVDVTKIKPRMLELAQKINWMPAHLKEGRFGNWLEGARDWSISRQRFWGSVLPIWVCDKCGEKKVMGSIADLEQASGQKVSDLHKDSVDKIVFKCDHCDGEMQRVKDVLDCWFESASMPYAQIHYPFANKNLLEKNFPAEFIAEGVDQTRCWFYYLLILSTALFDEIPFKNAVANGIVLAEDGRKMAKKEKNYPDPMELFEQYGVDAVRYYLATSGVVKAEDLNFSPKGVDEAVKKLLLILNNVLAFYLMYVPSGDVIPAGSPVIPAQAGICSTTDSGQPRGRVASGMTEGASPNLLDRWILTRLKQTQLEITAGYEKYDLNQATRPLLDLVTDLSTWFVRRSRDRFKGAGTEQAGIAQSADKVAALETLGAVLIEIAKLSAPAMPFVAEKIYRAVKNEKEIPAPMSHAGQACAGMTKGAKGEAGAFGAVREISVHLESWTEAAAVSDEENKILVDMATVRALVEIGHRLREEAEMPVRQALAAVNYQAQWQLTEARAQWEAILASELNVLRAEAATDEKNPLPADWPSKSDNNLAIALDTRLTPELKVLGYQRELVRQINDLRKQAGLTINDRIKIYTAAKPAEALGWIEQILPDVLAKSVAVGQPPLEWSKEIKLAEKTVWLGIEKV